MLLKWLNLALIFLGEKFHIKVFRGAFNIFVLEFSNVNSYRNILLYFFYSLTSATISRFLGEWGREEGFGCFFNASLLRLCATE